MYMGSFFSSPWFWYFHSTLARLVIMWDLMKDNLFFPLDFTLQYVAEFQFNWWYLCRGNVGLGALYLIRSGFFNLTLWPLLSSLFIPYCSIKMLHSFPYVKSSYDSNERTFIFSWKQLFRDVKKDLYVSLLSKLIIPWTSM